MSFIQRVLYLSFYYIRISHSFYFTTGHVIPSDSVPPQCGSSDPVPGPSNPIPPKSGPSTSNFMLCRTYIFIDYSHGLQVLAWVC